MRTVTWPVRYGGRLLAAVILLVLFAAPTVAMATTAPASSVPAALAQSSTATAGEMTPVELVKKVGPAVVTVINMQTAGNGLLGGGQAQPAGAGTGFFIDENGDIVTNWHVVDGGDSFVVIYADGSQHKATLVGQDPRSDLAVVKVKDKVPATVPLGNSDDLEVGQTVLAIGSPLGQFTNTGTEGIVSALGRNNLAQQGACQQYQNLIQHDAAINPGNSGGPLFDLKGQVVGVNTLGIPSENGRPVKGRCFAIRSNTVKQSVSQIIENGHVAYPYLGVSIVQLDPQLSAQNNISVDYGAYVTDIVSGGPADKAGVQTDDIILSIDGTKVTPDKSVSDLLFNHKPGDTIKLQILRGSDQTTVNLKLGELPQSVLQQCTVQGG
jgi:2-alkenal reductase